MMKRRTVLKTAGCSIAAAFPSQIARFAQASALTVSQLDVSVPEASGRPRRARLLIPNAPLGLNKPRPVLVLLHGLGETASQDLGLRAWPELYGLRDACVRLTSGVVRRNPRLNYLAEERLAEINRELSESPLSLPVLVCPVTPKPPKGASRKSFFDEYADWIEQALLPDVRSLLSARGTQLQTGFGLDGCSMGGFVAKEVYLRKAASVRSFGTVQSAISREAAVRYAAKFRTVLSQTWACPIHVETSTRDPFRAANERFSRALTSHGVENKLTVIPGPHSQPWLREVGTLEMLRFHSAALSRVNSSSKSLCSGSRFSRDERGGSSKSKKSKPGQTVHPTRQ